MVKYNKGCEKMNFLKIQESKIKSILKSFHYDVEEVSLIPSTKKELGDFQYNGIMAIAKRMDQNPLEIANLIAKELEKDKDFAKVIVAGAGFLNITFQDQALLNYANLLLEEKCYFEKLPSKKILIDYGGPNVAKVLHVGHLRSANIGESLKRLAKSLGYEVIGDVHLGDYGLQMGMIMLEIQTRYPDLSCFQTDFHADTVVDLPITNEDLINLYPIASQKAKADEKIMEKARHITYLLQQNDPCYKALWRSILALSTKDMKEIYQELDVHFDLWNGESDAEQFIPEMLDYLRKKSLTTLSEGAEIISVEEETDKLPVPPLLLIKSNETVSYETTDLATLWDRKKENYDEIWYVVDKRQELHFIQVFRAATKSSIIPKTTKLEFIGFGTMNGKDGKPFKTRDGGVLSLRELMNLVNEETDKNMIPAIQGEERTLTSKIITAATIKFADLLSHRATDYIFDLKKFSDTSGKTGPFILYSTVRMRSLLKKAKEEKIKKLYFQNFKVLSAKKVFLHLLNLQKVLEKSLQEKSLHELANYLYYLNNTYNNFYAENRILTEKEESVKSTWIALTKLVYDVNLLLLDILAIQVPTRM